MNKADWENLSPEDRKRFASEMLEKIKSMRKAIFDDWDSLPEETQKNLENLAGKVNSLLDILERVSSGGNFTNHEVNLFLDLLAAGASGRDIIDDYLGLPKGL